MRKLAATTALVVLLSSNGAMALSSGEDHVICNQLADTSRDAFEHRAGEWSDPTRGIYTNPKPLSERTCFTSLFGKRLDTLIPSVGDLFSSIANQLCSTALNLSTSVASSMDCGIYGSGIGFGNLGFGLGGKLCQNINVGGFGGSPIGVGMSSSQQSSVSVNGRNIKNTRDGTWNNGSGGGTFGGLFGQ
jgi:hypothetical protein